MALTKIDDRGLKTPIDLLDNEKIRLGTGNDLEIFHQSSDESSVIKNVNDTGWLRILSGDSNSSGILLKNRDDDVTYLKAFNEGSIELYHNNLKKFETTSSGISVSGSVSVDAGSNTTQAIFSGSGGSGTRGLAILTEAAGAADEGVVFNARASGTTATMKFQTNSSTALTIQGEGDEIDIPDNTKLRFGTGNDLEIYHSGTNTFIANSTGPLKIRSDTLELGAANGEQMLQGTANAAVNLYYDGVKKFETTSYGSAHTGIMRFENSGDGISFYDSRELKFGDGDDLKIYHTGTLSRIDNNTGDLLIRTNVASDVGGNIYLKPHDDEDGIIITHDAGVELYYNGVKKLNTESAGVSISAGNLYLGDDYSVMCGASQDLQIRHDGTNSHIINSTGELKLHGTNSIRLQHPTDGDTYLLATNNDSVDLYYNNSKKFETTANGIAVTGRIEPTDHIFMDASYGIVFDPYGASGANLLDDYEEGTWTPSLPNGGSVTTDAAHYTKIGRWVNVYCRATFAMTDNSSVFRIGGLPYTISGTDNYGGGTISYCAAADIHSLGLLPLISSTGGANAYFHRSDGNTASVKNNQLHDIDGSLELIMNWNYVLA